MINKSMLKKIVVSFLLAIFLLTSVSASYAKAMDGGGSWYNQSFQEWYSKVYDDSNPSEIFGERYTAAQVQWIIYGLFSFVLNSTTDDPKTTTCIMNNDMSDCIDRVKNIFASNDTLGQPYTDEGVSTFLAAVFEERPLSAVHYFKEIGRKLKLVPEAKAQTGFGFNALDPILPLWKGVRNISYMLFILITLVLAFMIMFRVKISPQIVISVQSALPKIVIALVLVTFSYAIAGFLVDLMYVVIGLISMVLASALDLSLVKSTLIFNLLTKGILNTGVFGFLFLYIVMFFLAFVSALFGATGGVLGFIGATIFSSGAFIPVVTILGILATIILAIVLFFVTFKIIFMLVKTFANILLLTILAPFQIAMGALIPSFGFGAWLKSYVANLAVFPITGLLIILSYIFLGRVFVTAFDSWMPFELMDILNVTPLAIFVDGSAWPPLLGIGAERMIPLLYLGVSFIILTIIPKTADIIKSMIEGKPFAYGTAIGEAFGPARSTAGYGAALGVGKVGQRIQEKMDDTPYREAVGTISKAIGEKLAGGR
jgi:hypothetical protein